MLNMKSSRVEKIILFENNISYYEAFINRSISAFSQWSYVVSRESNKRIW